MQVGVFNTSPQLIQQIQEAIEHRKYIVIADVKVTENAQYGRSIRNADITILANPYITTQAASLTSDFLQSLGDVPSYDYTGPVIINFPDISIPDFQVTHDGTIALTKPLLGKAIFVHDSLIIQQPAIIKNPAVMLKLMGYTVAEVTERYTNNNFNSFLSAWHQTPEVSTQFTPYSR